MRVIERLNIVGCSRLTMVCSMYYLLLYGPSNVHLNLEVDASQPVLVRVSCHGEVGAGSSTKLIGLIARLPSTISLVSPIR